jgi:hypothetical protein
MKPFYVAMFILIAFALGSKAQTNIIENQTNWPSGNYVNSITNSPETNTPPYGSYWASSKSAEFNATNGQLVVGTIPGGSSFTCWTYFAPSNSPVTLTPGHTLQMTWDFFVIGTGVQNPDRHLRVGLLYSGINQSTNSGTAPGDNIDGYAQQMNFGTTFGIAPLQTDADTNQDEIHSVFSTSGDFIQIGDNGGGTTNDPGFEDSIPYTMYMTISEQSTDSVSITTTIVGSTFTNGMITQTVTDTNYCYTNFDTFVMRPNDGDTTATNFTTTQFEITTYPTPASKIIASLQVVAPSAYALSWPSTVGATYTIYRTNQLDTLVSNWNPITTGYPTGGAGGGTISYTDRPAGPTEFYRISSP